MSTLTGHLSLYATQSLKAIDNWMNVTQGNIGGSLRTSYKEVELMYGGNLTHELRSVSQSRNGVQIAEQTLTTGNTRINWRQGEIINSTQDTHFAINGDGFFLVHKPTAATIAGFPNSISGVFGLISGGGNQNDLYLTRQGDFHWGKIQGDPNPDRLFLLTNEGYLVLADHGDGNDVYGPMTLDDFNRTSAMNATFFRLRPSIVQPTYDTTIGTASPITNVVDYDELQYSKLGSSYFKAPTCINFKTLVEGSANLLDRKLATDSSSGTLLIENALEASNVKVERNITELASMGKIYNGFVQLIKVYNSNLDEVLGFIR
jgi:flagellar basal body rod protein FlgG